MWSSLMIAMMIFTTMSPTGAMRATSLECTLSALTICVIAVWDVFTVTAKSFARIATGEAKSKANRDPLRITAEPCGSR